MLALALTNKKDFMNKLLRTDLFDHFLLSEAAIRGKGSYEIDGHLVPDFYSPEELNELELTGLSCLPFGMLRENCFALIKGKHTPSYFRFIFQLSPKNLKNTLEVSKSGLTTQDLNGVFLNIKFQDGILSCTNGVSYRSFTLDHTFDQEWDMLIRKFFAGHDIPYTDIN